MSPSLQVVIDMVENQFPLLKAMGLEVLVLEPGRVKLRLPKVGNENHMGSIWAGALFTLAELPGGALVYSLFDGGDYLPMVKEMTIRYRRPALTDAFIEMTLPRERAGGMKTEADANGYADFTLEGEVTDAHGEVVAVTRGEYRMQRMKG